MDVRHRTIIALSSLSLATTSAKNLSGRRDAPCYAAVTAFVADSAPLRVHRIVTTGVRRFLDARTLQAPACVPSDQLRADSLRAEIMVQLGNDGRRAQWVRVASTDSNVVGDHLARLARFAVDGVHPSVVRVGSDSDLVSLAAHP